MNKTVYVCTDTICIMSRFLIRVSSGNCVMKMKRYIHSAFYAALLLLFTVNVSAQYYDSIIVTSSVWNVEKISRGIKLYSKQFSNKSLFRSNQFITYAIIKKRSNVFHIEAEPKLSRTTSSFADSAKAIVAINGNFFDMKNGGAVDFTKVNGIVVNTNRTAPNEKLSFHQKAAIVINNGRPAIRKWDGLVNWSDFLNEEDVMLNGPLLFLNKVQEGLDSSSSFTITRHPRTCFGITKRGHIIMLVADGRNAKAQGLNLFELTKVMRWLGCISAINFDGGGSSTLWVKGRGVVNHPSDNGKWDNNGERKVANILYVRKRQKH